MAWIKAIAVVVIAWALQGALHSLIKPFLEAEMMKGLPFLPMPIVLVMLAVIIGLAVCLVTAVKLPVRREAWIWLLWVWAAGFMASVYVTDVVEPAVVCKRAESLQVTDVKQYEVYKTSSLKIDCDREGRTPALGVAGKELLWGKILFSILGTALLHLLMLVSFRSFRMIRERWILFGVVVLTGTAYALLMHMFFHIAYLQTFKLVSPDMLVIPFPAIAHFLGYWGAMAMGGLAAFGAILQLLCFCRWLKRDWERGEE